MDDLLTDLVDLQVKEQVREDREYDLGKTVGGGVWHIWRKHPYTSGWISLCNHPTKTVPGWAFRDDLQSRYVCHHCRARWLSRRVRNA